jgi:hypothetical protein
MCRLRVPITLLQGGADRNRGLCGTAAAELPHLRLGPDQQPPLPSRLAVCAVRLIILLCWWLARTCAIWHSELDTGSRRICRAAVAHASSKTQTSVSPCAWRTIAADVRAGCPSRPSAREWPCLQQTHPKLRAIRGNHQSLGRDHMQQRACSGSSSKKPRHLIYLLPCLADASRPLPELHAPTHAARFDGFLATQANYLDKRSASAPSSCPKMHNASGRGGS